MTYDTKGIWRCYEIKISKADFHSKNHNTFIGNYNYYVLTQDLYNQIKDEIPNGIGVYVGKTLVKRAKKQELKVKEKTLYESMIRSLHRYFEKHIDSNNEYLIDCYKREINQTEKMLRNSKIKCGKYFNWIYDNYGVDKIHEIEKGEFKNR